jgi:hypothetical protein
MIYDINDLCKESNKVNKTNTNNITIDDGKSILQYISEYIMNNNYLASIDLLYETRIVDMFIDNDNNKPIVYKPINTSKLLINLLDRFIFNISKINNIFYKKFYSINFKYMNTYNIYKLYNPNTILEYKHYIYTNLLIEDSLFDKFSYYLNREYNKLSSDINRLNTVKSYNMNTDLCATMVSISKYIKDSESINTIFNNMIDPTNKEDSFISKLFKYYRNNDTEYSMRDIVDYETFLEACKYYKFNKIFITRVYDRLINIVSELKDNIIDNTTMLNYFNINENNIYSYNNTIKHHYNRINDICNNYTIIYAAKLDAILEFICRNNDIINMACDIIKEEENNGK